MRAKLDDALGKLLSKEGFDGRFLDLDTLLSCLEQSGPFWSFHQKVMVGHSMGAATVTM